MEDINHTTGTWEAGSSAKGRSAVEPKEWESKDNIVDFDSLKEGCSISSGGSKTHAFHSPLGSASACSLDCSELKA